MADTKQGREKQARNAERRQVERDLREALERGDEPKPPEPTAEDEEVLCRRRGCSALATFMVVERYQEETGQGAVEARAVLCQSHTEEEGPANLDDSYPGYVFRIEPLPEGAPTAE